MTAWSSKRWVWLSYLAIGLVALALRVWHLGSFVTIDEVKFWLPRSERFLQALQNGAPDAMPLVGHPGVTTMWLGSAGIALRRFLFDSGILTHETYATLLALHRLPTVLLHVAAILVGYRMLRLLLPAAMAFLAAWLWATDPFIIAFSRVLHVDALAGTLRHAQPAGRSSKRKAQSAERRADGADGAGERGCEEARMRRGGEPYGIASRVPASRLACAIGRLRGAGRAEQIARAGRGACRGNTPACRGEEAGRRGGEEAQR